MVWRLKAKIWKTFNCDGWITPKSSKTIGVLNPKTITSVGQNQLVKNHLMVMVKAKQNHWKTIKTTDKQVKKHLMVMVKAKQNHWNNNGANGSCDKKNITIPSPPKIQALQLFSKKFT